MHINGFEKLSRHINTKIILTIVVHLGVKVGFSSLAVDGLDSLDVERLAAIAEALGEVAQPPFALAQCLKCQEAYHLGRGLVLQSLQRT